MNVSGHNGCNFEQSQTPSAPVNSARKSCTIGSIPSIYHSGSAAGRTDVRANSAAPRLTTSTTWLIGRERRWSPNSSDLSCRQAQ